ncbi:porin family protein [uncultured Winogradskyella sp.]|uniref:porin family protein n=1 Tax=uncultured Winogradskyella sp. TaxID=395353 RepID=UPI002638E5B1|nr:porin family protein [uncultured Winogradskyella sp.]
MKKVLLTSTLLMFISLSFSQSNESTKYGIRAGVNVSNLDFDPGPTEKNLHRNGFYFGGFAEFYLSEKLWVNTELLWSAEGGKDENWRANYLSLPIQLKFHLGDRLSVGAGPQIGVKTWKSSDAFDTFNFSGVAGVQYQIFQDYFIEIRGIYGFTNMLDDVLAPLEAKQFVIQAGIGIKI